MELRYPFLPPLCTVPLKQNTVPLQWNQEAARASGQSQLKAPGPRQLRPPSPPGCRFAVRVTCPQPRPFSGAAREQRPEPADRCCRCPARPPLEPGESGVWLWGASGPVGPRPREFLCLFHLLPALGPVCGPPGPPGGGGQFRVPTWWQSSHRLPARRPEEWVLGKRHLPGDSQTGRGPLSGEKGSVC